MQQVFEEIKVKTNGQGFYNFTQRTLEWLNNQKIKNGILNINIMHTSAHDLKNFFHKLVPMDEKLYKHSTEGKDDMPAHIKSALTNNQLTLSLKNKNLILGTWQGLYLFEHRIEKQTRVLSHHLIGD